MKKIILLIMILSLFTQSFFVVASENDEINTNYIEAESLLRSLGIINEEIEYTKTITRGEMAKYITSLLSETELAVSYRGIFSDVPETHEYSLYIEHLANKGIIKGDGNFNFRPDDKILYDHAMIMIINTLGYGVLEDISSTYYTWANEYNLYKNLVLEFDYVNTGDLLVLMENALYANLLARDGYGSEKQYAVTDNTLLSTVYKVTYDDGIIVKNDVTYLWSASNVNSKTITIDTGDSYNLEIKVSDPLKTTYDLGKKVRVFYRNDTEEYEYIYHRVSEKNDILHIELKFIDSLKTNQSYTDLEYLYQGTEIKNVKISNDAYILYNGATYKNSSIDLESLKNMPGYIELIDYNSDKKYDVINIKAYETIIANEIFLKDNIVTDKYNNKIIDFSPDKHTRVTVYDKNGKISSAEQIVSGNILSVAKSDTFGGENCIEIRISDNVKTGKITDVYTDYGITEIQLDNINKYYTSDRAFNASLSINSFVMVYIDVFNNAVHIKSDYGRDMQYGVALKTVYRQTGNSEYVIMKMLTPDGYVSEMKLSDKVKVDGIYYNNDAQTVYKKLKTVKIKSDGFKISEDVIIVRFQTNEANEIKTIDTHNSGGNSSSEDVLELIGNDTYVASTGNILGWTIPVSSDATLLQITSRDYSNVDVYTYNFAGASLSAGSAYSVAVFKSDPESRCADFIVILRGGVGLSTSYYVVENVSLVYNEEKDCTMYKTKGYLKGVYEEFWIDDANSYTTGMKDLKCGDIIRVVNDLDNMAFKFDKVVVSTNSGTNFIKVSGDSYAIDESTTLNNVFGYVYDKEGTFIVSNKFAHGIIPDKASDISWDSTDLLCVNLSTTLPIVVVDTKREKVEIGTISDIKDYLTYGDEASKILAKYRNSQLQEIYVFN